MRRLFIATLLTALFTPTGAWADNTTSAGAYDFAVGGTPVEAVVSSVGPVDRWYTTRVHLGRSYCAETQGGVSFDASATAGSLDTILTIYQGDATTVLLSNDDVAGAEPAGKTLSRVCFRNTLTDPTGAIIYIKISSKSGTFNTRMRFVETTRYSNWFFLGGDYNAFTLIRNTTNLPLAYTIEWRDAGGVLVGTTSGILAASGGAAVNARSFVTGATSGTVQIAHDGPESAVVASTTVLSGSTGLSFDSPFETRRPW